jgi:hypothetical protein
MERERWRERGNVRFRLRERERKWGVLEIYLRIERGVLEVDGEKMLEVEVEAWREKESV